MVAIWAQAGREQRKHPSSLSNSAPGLVPGRVSSFHLQASGLVARQPPGALTSPHPGETLGDEGSCLAAWQGCQESRPRVTLILGLGERRALPCYCNVPLWVRMGPSASAFPTSSSGRTLSCCRQPDSSAPFAGTTTALRSSPTMTCSLPTAPRWLRGTRPASV